ncbi:septum formation family protein [Georgenia yuyongxinii]|uniref:Septum formation family protein n=1 Tax=Georgenia yuyongxinii TaxID=2589797 RepID=A0A5B8C943_9MICO|nr:septum formation family protein [Georgenia yuyongxinii]QDC26041.1 septum formation family protein [Georgenia yuyongxinii]
MHASARLVAPLLGLLALVAVSGCGGGDVMALKEGDCLKAAALDSDTAVSDVTVIDCADPHDAEVFTELTLDDRDFPGEKALQTRALELCRPEFEQFVGRPYDESELYYSALTPTQESWERAEDRTALCILLSDDPVIGTLAGTKR